jgi:hypothetical protein
VVRGPAGEGELRRPGDRQAVLIGEAALDLGIHAGDTGADFPVVGHFADDAELDTLHLTLAELDEQRRVDRIGRQFVLILAVVDGGGESQRAIAQFPLGAELEVRALLGVEVWVIDVIRRGAQREVRAARWLLGDRMR